MPAKKLPTKKATPTPRPKPTSVKRSTQPLRSLTNAVRNGYRLKRARDEAADAFKEAEAGVIEAFHHAKEHTVAVVVDGTEVLGTLIDDSSTVEIDWDALRQDIGDDTYERLLVKSPDRGLLEALVTTGEIDGALVAKHSTLKPRKPYVRYTAR